MPGLKERRLNMETAPRSSAPPLSTAPSIQALRSADNSRFWADEVVDFVASSPRRGGTEPGSGCIRAWFLAAKFWVSRDGMPAVMDQWCAICWMRGGGRALVEGRMRRMSQWMLRARRCSVEIFVGRIIQRTTWDITKGVKFEDLRVERKVGRAMVGWRDMRWRVQSGIVKIEGNGSQGVTILSAVSTKY